METKKLKDWNTEAYPFSWAIEDENGEKSYVIRFDGIPDVIGVGETYDEAYDNAQEALATLFDSYEENGYEIPEPPDQRLRESVRRKRPLITILLLLKALVGVLSLLFMALGLVHQYRFHDGEAFFFVGAIYLMLTPLLGYVVKHFKAKTK